MKLTSEGSGGSVLVVDAAKPWGELLCDSFRAAGFAAFHAMDSASALSIIIEARPSIVCSELSFGDADWTSLLPACKLGDRRSRLVLVTDHATPQIAFDALRLGCDLVLTKPALASDVLAGAPGAMRHGTLSLKEAKAAYVRSTAASSSSVAEAARTLRLDPRSLRRMLRQGVELTLRSTSPTGRRGASRQGFG